MNSCTGYVVLRIPVQDDVALQQLIDLGFTGTEIRLRGTTTGSGQALDTNYFYVQTTASNCQYIESLLQELLTSIEAGIDLISEIAGESEDSLVSIVLPDLEDFKPALSLSRKVLKALNRLNVGLEIDL